ncbi:SIR2 family protein [uncultured Deefgea sp.]|uniref:SIR2 family protein n=1 Tax=uncultured Deefgea sp. TaxID=1304914 RepID=UPI0026387DF0|nr:SIR2 family protein [uncultured Deefgea sp.]
MQNVYHYLDENSKDIIAAHYKRSQLIPFIGAGFTKGQKSKRGLIPGGVELLDGIKKLALKSVNLAASDKESIEKIQSLKVAFNLLSEGNAIDHEMARNYLINSFSKVSISKNRSNFINLDWPTVITFNIDDAIELANREFEVIRPLREISIERVKRLKCLIKIHGCITEYANYLDPKLVFTWKQYISSFSLNKSLMEYIESSSETKNFLFVGCSLEEELDVMQLSQRDVFKKSIYLTKGEPSFVERMKLKEYGIDTVIYFDEYDQIYDWIYSILSKEVVESRIEDLNLVREPKISNLKDNIDFIINGGPVIQKKDNIETARWPEICGVRDVVKNICEEINRHQFILLNGRRFSGKTLALVQLYEELKQFQIYFFSSHQPFNPRLLNLIRGSEKCLFIFDSNYLRGDSALELIKNAGSNRFIIALNTYENSLYNAFQALSDVAWKEYSINPRLSQKEQNESNSLLNQAGLPKFESSETLLNNAYRNFEMQKLTHSSRVFKSNLTNSHYKALILLGAFSKVDSLHIRAAFDTGFNITEFVIGSNDLFDLEIYREETVMVCNSQQWLVRLLSDFASNEHERAADLVSDLAKSLYVHGQIESADVIINFDLLNSIFSWNKTGAAYFVRSVYKRLANPFGQKSHYWLQMAKCELRSASSIDELNNGYTCANKAREDNKNLKNRTYYSATLVIAQLLSRLYIKTKSEDTLSKMLFMYTESLDNYINNKGYVNKVKEQYKKRGLNDIFVSIHALTTSVQLLPYRDDVNKLTSFMEN